MKKRIAILFHESARRRDPRDYAIHALSRFWENDGHSVARLHGVKRFVPADVLFLHVDLSVVPDEYLDFAARYPAVVNGRARDVRKSAFSENRVGPEDAYPGRVIVKSNLNYAGIPERLAAGQGPRGLAELFRRRREALPQAEFRTPLDYRVYDSLPEVPRGDFAREDLIVEKFLPEIEDGLYWVRLFHFLGDRMACLRIASPNPIVKVDNQVKREIVGHHPEVVEMKERLGFDYGKFDYVVHEGKVVLLDANKTPGESRVIRPEILARLRHLAFGLQSLIS